MTAEEQARAAFQVWLDELPRSNKRSTVPHPGTLAVALVVLDRLRTTFDLNLDFHLTAGGGQVRGAGGEAVRRVLHEFNEERPLPAVGGRSSRGTINHTRNLLAALEASGLADLDSDERTLILTSLLEVVVGKVRAFHSQQRLKPVYDPSRSTRQFISDLLALAEETGKRGSVAQYLVGAKLQLRFPGILVRNESASAADDPTGQPGDFVVRDTTFHVTVAPMLGHFEKCQRNLQEGLRVFLLVPDDFVVRTRINAEMTAPGRIAMESIESFVAQNIEELSEFDRNSVTAGLRRLLDTYNARVDAADIDKSVMVELPRTLAQQGGGA